MFSSTVPVKPKSWPEWVSQVGPSEILHQLWSTKKIERVLDVLEHFSPSQESKGVINYKFRKALEMTFIWYIRM